MKEEIREGLVDGGSDIVMMIGTFNAEDISRVTTKQNKKNWSLIFRFLTI